MALSQEEIEALDPGTRKMYEQVTALAEEKGLDTDSPEFWQNFAANVHEVVPRMMGHVKNYKEFERRMGRA